MKLDVREVGYEDVNAVMGVFFTSYMSGNCLQKTALNMVCAAVTC